MGEATGLVKLPRGNCTNCGKVIPVRDIRAKGAAYCGRICAAMGRFRTRFRGTGSGPADRPDFEKKTKQL